MSEVLPKPEYSSKDCQSKSSQILKEWYQYQVSLAQLYFIHLIHALKNQALFALSSPVLNCFIPHALCYHTGRIRDRAVKHAGHFQRKEGFILEQLIWNDIGPIERGQRKF